MAILIETFTGAGFDERTVTKKATQASQQWLTDHPGTIISVTTSLTMAPMIQSTGHECAFALTIVLATTDPEPEHGREP